MSERFIKYIPSPEALWLKEKHPWAFLLLTTIAERARRVDGLPDGIKKGECQIGDHNAFGATRQQYRTALDVLTRISQVLIEANCRTRQKSTTGPTIYGTLVKLISSSIYDINLESDNHQSNHPSTTDQPPTNHEQERIKNDKNQMIDDNHPDPSFSKVVRLDDSDLTDLTQEDPREKSQLQHNTNDQTLDNQSLKIKSHTDFLTFRHKKYIHIQIEKEKLIEKFEPNWMRDEIDAAIAKMQKQDPILSGSIEKYLIKILENQIKEKKSCKTKYQTHKKRPMPSKPSSMKDSEFYLGPDTSECPLAKFAFQNASK